jgi:hypothetical protein
LAVLRALAAEGFQSLDRGQCITLAEDRQLADFIAKIGRRASKACRPRFQRSVIDQDQVETGRVHYDGMDLRRHVRDEDWAGDPGDGGSGDGGFLDLTKVGAGDVAQVDRP